MPAKTKAAKRSRSAAPKKKDRAEAFRAAVATHAGNVNAYATEMARKNHIACLGGSIHGDDVDKLYLACQRSYKALMKFAPGKVTS